MCHCGRSRPVPRLAGFGRPARSPDAQAAGGTNGRYGLGVDLYEHDGTTTTVGHPGVNRGFHAQLLVNPEDDVALAVVTNGDNGAAVVEAVLDAWHDA